MLQEITSLGKFFCDKNAEVSNCVNIVGPLPVEIFKNMVDIAVLS